MMDLRLPVAARATRSTYFHITISGSLGQQRLPRRGRSDSFNLPGNRLPANVWKALLVVMAPQSSPGPEAPASEWIARFVADIPSAVALFDRDMRYAAANNRWLNAFGVVGEGVIGQCHEQIDPASATLLADLHRRALAGETVE